MGGLGIPGKASAITAIPVAFTGSLTVVNDAGGYPALFAILLPIMDVPSMTSPGALLWTTIPGNRLPSMIFPLTTVFQRVALGPSAATTIWPTYGPGFLGEFPTIMLPKIVLFMITFPGLKPATMMPQSPVPFT